MTFNPLHGDGSQIYMIVVLRFTDKTIVASFISSKDVAVEGVRECVAGNSNMIAGKRYTSQGSNQAIHYTIDAQGRVYCLVTSPKYSPRIAFGALDELIAKFNKEVGSRVATATEGSLSRTTTPIFKELCDKFGNPANVDKITAVQEKVDVVKSTMKDNIQQLLVNEEKLERIEASTLHLNEQAGAFKHSSKDLANKMWWKMVKMRLLIGGLITAVLILIIVPLAVAGSQK